MALPSFLQIQLPAFWTDIIRISEALEIGLYVIVKMLLKTAKIQNITLNKLLK